MQDDKVKSSLINVEALQKEYEVILQQYQEAVKNYIAALESRESNGDSKTIQFAALKGRTWWGSGSGKEGIVDTQEECENMCANTTNCSGATFNPVKRYCWARTGDGSLSVGETDDYALIPKQKAALTIMKQLNEKLLLLNEQITNEIKIGTPYVEEQEQDKNTKQEQLYKSYEQLLEQQTEMDNILKEYSSIEEEIDNQQMYVNQQAASMKFWSMIACIVILLTMKQMYGDDSPPIIFTGLLVIVIILILLSFLFGSSY